MVVLSAISFFVGMQFKDLFRSRVSNVNSYAGWAPDDSGISKPKRGRRRQRKSRSLRHVKSAVVDAPDSQANNIQIVEPDDFIPKVLVQSYVDVSKVPPKVYDNVKKFAPGWKHRIYDDANATAFLKEHFRPEVAARFNNLTNGAHKADLFRYAVLYINGGVWLDVDVELRDPLDDIFRRNNTIYTTKSGVFDDIFQAILGSPRGKDFMNDLVEEIVESDLNGGGLPFTVWFKDRLRIPCTSVAASIAIASC